MNPKAKAVADIAVGLLSKPTIPYKLGGETIAAMDCQGMVEYCVRQAGGTISFAGSNDMFRHACQWVGTIAVAKQQGILVPGAVVFIVNRDGSEPAKYQGNGYGDASHVGLYCGAPEAEIMNASSSRGCVAPSTLKNAWTHVGWLNSVAYSTADSPNISDEPDEDCLHITVCGHGAVRMRLTPSDTGKYMGRIPEGGSFDVLEQHVSGDEIWYRVGYGGFTKWWVKDGPYLECDDEPDAPDYEYDPNVPDIRAAILYIEAAQASLESMLGSLESVHESLTRG